MEATVKRARTVASVGVLIGLLACVSALICVNSSAAESGAVRVRARIESAIGRRFGGQFFVLYGEPRQVYAVGATDADGEVDVEVPCPADIGEIVIVVRSRGLVGNTADEIRSAQRDGPIAGWSQAVADPRDMRMHMTAAAIESLREELLEWGEDHTKTIGPWQDPVGQILDSVARVRRAEDRTVDFGVVRFPTVAPAAEVELRLRDADDSPSRQEVYLGGWVGDPMRLGGNPVYPHMALSQRGDRVRVLLSRAGARLLRTHPAETIFLDSASRSFDTIRVLLSHKQLRLGDPHHVAAVEVRLPVSKEAGEGRRTVHPAPQVPRNWDFMEPWLRGW